MIGRRCIVIAWLLSAPVRAWAGEVPNDVARGASDAVVAIALPGKPDGSTLSDDWAVEFDAVPLSFQPTAPFLIEVSVRNGRGEDSTLGLMAFYPPLAVGQPRRFLVPLPASIARGGIKDGKLTMAVGLVPAVPSDELDGTAVKIEHARIAN